MLLKFQGKIKKQMREFFVDLRKNMCYSVTKRLNITFIQQWESWIRKKNWKLV